MLSRTASDRPRRAIASRESIEGGRDGGRTAAFGGLDVLDAFNGLDDLDVDVVCASTGSEPRATSASVRTVFRTTASPSSGAPRDGRLAVPGVARRRVGSSVRGPGGAFPLLDSPQARPGNDGKYIVRNLPAGEYFVAALTDLAPGDTSDPAFLAQVAASAAKVTVTDGATTVQAFKIGGPQ